MTSTNFDPLRPSLRPWPQSSEERADRERYMLERQQPPKTWQERDRRERERNAEFASQRRERGQQFNKNGRSEGEMKTRRVLSAIALVLGIVGSIVTQHPAPILVGMGLAIVWMGFGMMSKKAEAIVLVSLAAATIVAHHESNK